MEISRQDGETYTAFLKRIVELTRDKKLTYNEMGDYLLGDKNVYSSENLRKAFYILDKIVDNIELDYIVTDNELVTLLDEKTLEFEKARIKCRDEKNDLRKAIRQEARKESYLEMVRRVICEEVEPINIAVQNESYHSHYSSTDLLAHFTDIHTGIEIDNWGNKFDEVVLKQRVEKYTSEILRVRENHESEDLYLVIGEVLSGLIHPNLRLQNNLDLMESFKYISELISGMLMQFSKSFNKVYVYVTPGNHSRISPKKEDALDGENMDILLPFNLKDRMQNVKNIEICDNEIEPSIAMFSIRGNTVMSSHGDKDKPESVVQNFTMMFGMKPKIVLLGHRHTNGMSTVYDTKVIQSGCVSGTDNYATSIRKANKAEQTVSVIGNDGLICLYDIQLN